MDARSFDEFHNAGNEDIFAVAGSVNFDFFADNVFIDKDRSVCIDLYCCAEVMTEAFLIGNDLHRSAAKNIGRTNKNRVTDRRCRCNAVFNVGNGCTLRLRNTKLCQ